MPAESHTMMDGKVHVYRRENSRFWQCAVYLGGRNHRTTTGHDRLVLALDFAEEWYLERYADERLRRRGVAVPSTEERSEAYANAVDSHPAKTRKAGKAATGPTFSPAEYKRLYEATRERAKNPKNERWRGECEQFHDYVLFMANTGLRPDEASRLQFRDVTIVMDDATDERILEIEVRGKRGVGYCKSMAGAVTPFTRLRKRNARGPNDLIFGKVQRELLNAVLEELDLKKDREGNLRTAYSLRHTYICMRLMEGADIYQIAKNCRTSVEMIEKFYASHIKNTLDAAAINVRKKPKARKTPSAPEALANA